MCTEDLVMEHLESGQAPCFAHMWGPCCPGTLAMIIDIV